MVSIGIALLVCITARTQQRHPIDHTVFAFAYAAILLHVVERERGILVTVLSVPSLRFMGLISYPLYLFHEPCTWAVRLVVGKLQMAVGDHLIVAMLAAPLSILLAAILHRFIGDPFVRIGRRLANPIRRQPPLAGVAIEES